jgi:hypothetical protein
MSKETAAGVAMAADPGVQKAVIAAAGASGAAAWWTHAKEIALELFGVPLPVVLACATVAYGALSFRSGMSYCRTLLAGVVWTVAGTWGAQLALFLIAKLLGLDLAGLPPAALGGAGMAVSGAGALLVTRENVDKLRAAVGRRLDNIGKGQP